MHLFINVNHWSTYVHKETQLSCVWYFTYHIRRPRQSAQFTHSLDLLTGSDWNRDRHRDGDSRSPLESVTKELGLGLWEYRGTGFSVGQSHLQLPTLFIRNVTNWKKKSHISADAYNIVIKNCYKSKSNAAKYKQKKKKTREKKRRIKNGPIYFIFMNEKKKRKNQQSKQPTAWQINKVNNKWKWFIWIKWRVCPIVNEQYAEATFAKC